MNKDRLKSALGKIWAITYRSTQIDEWEFRSNFKDKLIEALEVIESEWGEDDALHRQAMEFCHSVRTSGLCSKPYRKPNFEVIEADQKRLARHLDLISN